MDKLEQVIDNLVALQRAERKAGRSTAKRCSEFVRRALEQEGLKYPRMLLAIESFRVLAKNPGRYGWEVIHSPLTQDCMVFFKDCGKLKDGRIAGHVALYSPKDAKLYGNKTYNWGSYWQKRIVGAFIPL